MRKLRLLLIFIILLVSPKVVLAQSGDSVVHAVLFHSPSCGHCQYVIEEVLPPLQEQFGEKLDVLMVDTSTGDGKNLYQAMKDQYQPEPNRTGVPSLVIDDRLLVGSVEIPGELPEIITNGLAAGGIDWPKLEGLDALLADNTAGDENLTKKALLGADTLVAVVTLGSLLVSLVVCGNRIWLSRSNFKMPFPGQLRERANWYIPLLCIAGLYVASYLAHKELTQSSVACGPLAGCDTVQTSEFVIFMGIPMALWGVAAYLVILAGWTVGEFAVRKKAKTNRLAMIPDDWHWVIRPALLGFSYFTVLFSTYLTGLEVLVIKATCTWCVGSAIISATICWMLTMDRGWLPMAPSRNSIRRRRRQRV